MVLLNGAEKENVIFTLFGSYISVVTNPVFIEVTIYEIQNLSVYQQSNHQGIIINKFIRHVSSMVPNSVFSSFYQAFIYSCIIQRVCAWASRCPRPTWTNALNSDF